MRLAGLKSIDANLDLGNGLTVKEYEKKIGNANTTLEEYNTTLSIADEKLNIFETDEKTLKDFHERVLLAVGAIYGKDSVEYEKAGGTRKSERRKTIKAKA